MKNIYIILFIICLLTFQVNLFAQFRYKLIPQKSQITVSGTSSLHDWSMQMETASGSVMINAERNSLQQIREVNFSGPASSLLSNNSIMNDKAHNALKADKHPSIEFKMTSVDLQESRLNQFKGNVHGYLHVAGITREVIIPFSGSVSELNSMKVIGSQKLKMSDFKIDPPRAMLGALKTGDEVTISFTLEFINDSEASR